MEVKKVQRKSNFELLRIFAILMVILSHFNVHSGFSEQISDPFSFNFNYLLTNILSIGCFANAIFIIITGYFMVKSKIKPKKILGLLVEMYFYSLGIALVFYLMSPEKFASTANWKSILLPFPFGNWFTVFYIALYVIIPLLNKFIGSIKEKTIKKIILIYVPVAFIVSQLIKPFPLSFSITNMSAFVGLYLIGAYIRLAKFEVSRKKVLAILFTTLILYIATITSSYILSIVARNQVIFSIGRRFIFENTSIFVAAIGTMLFLLFKDIDLKYNKTINTIAASVLGIYLIHDNGLVSRLIWHEIIPVNINNIDLINLCIIALLKVAVVFVVCVIIDQIRIFIFSGKLYNTLIKFYCKFYLLLSPREQKLGIMSVKDMSEYILKNNLSLIRLGDGEFRFIYFNRGIKYQKYDKNLAKELKNIYSNYSNNERYLLAVPDIFEKSKDWYKSVPETWTMCFAPFRFKFRRDRNKTALYGNAFFFSKQNVKNYKKLWADEKRVVLVHNDEKWAKVFEKKYKVKVDFVKVASINSYSNIHEIEEKIRKINKRKKKKILISSGPTAKVVAYHLANDGFIVYDTGHFLDEPLESIK